MCGSRTLCVIAVGAIAVLVSVLLIPKTCLVPSDLLLKDLTGQTWLVTGGNVGIGYETAEQLARQGATVVIGCRSVARASGAVERAGRDGVTLHAMTLDLADLDSVRNFAEAFSARFTVLDGIVANAGVMVPPLSRTVQGHESQWGVNHLAHVLLVDLLRPQLEASPAGRVVVVSSRASEFGTIDLDDPDFHGKPYSSASAYCASKLANVLFARVLASRLTAEGSKVTAASLHPGAVLTELGRHLPYSSVLVPVLQPLLLFFLKSPWEGAQTSLYAALADGIPSGAYLSDCGVVTHALESKFGDDAEKLWAASRAEVGLPPWPASVASSG